jgi:hypothetical protein
VSIWRRFGVRKSPKTTLNSDMLRSIRGRFEGVAVEVAVVQPQGVSVLKQPSISAATRV